MMLKRSIKLRIIPDTTAAPSRVINDVPWYPGITIFDAMLIADGMFEDNFTFTLTYTSEYGAWLNAVDGKENSSTEFWLFEVNGVQTDEGLSSFVIDKPAGGVPVILDLIYAPYKGGTHPSS